MDIRPVTVTIKLPETWVDHLSNLPESGMGYHKVDVSFDDGSIQRGCVVLNAESIEISNRHNGKEIMDIRPHKPTNQ